MPVINGVYLKDFPALPSSVADANIIPIAISGNQIAYKTTVAGIVTDARVTSKLLTGLSVTGSTILATDTILQAFGKVQNQLNGKVSSVGLTMPSAFNVANSPITSAGTLAVTAAGVASQYIRGDGALADFPTTGGGGSSVSYYLNGSVSQGTIGGNAYYEMNKTPVIGTGTDFSIAADGYIAQFITDANDPASLLIPGGNWNVEMYFSASSSGGTPSFYVEVYKYDGSTFTLLGSSATTPEGITNGTAIDIYYTSVGIPETVLTITDRLAIRVYVTHSGRTITLHTEDNHLSEIVTTFSNGLTALNGLTKQTQYFATGTTGTDFNISSSVDTHTFNIPSASASNRGLITTGSQTLAGTKTFNDNISVSTSTANSAIQVTSTKADGRALSVLATSSLEPFAVTQNGAGKLAAFSNSSGEKFIIYNSGSFEANGATLYANLDGTTATFTGLLTGTTATFTNSGSGIGVGVTNSGSGDGIKITHSLGRAFRIESSSTGYGIIINNLTASTSVPFTIQKQGSTVITMSDTGAANFTGQLTLGSTITNGTYTYTLPSATGTLALTSALSSYLPLSGGTLTGALSGTSATFSDTTDITANNSTAINLVLRGRALDSVGQMELWNNAKSTRYGYIAADSTGMAISSTQAIPLTFGTNTTTRLTITSTGQVSVGAALTGRLCVRGTTNDSTAYAFEAGNSSGNTLFAVRNDGAATFTGTVETTSATFGQIKATNSATTGTNRGAGFRATSTTNGGTSFLGDLNAISNNANAPYNSVDGIYLMSRTSGFPLGFTVNNAGTELLALSIASTGAATFSSSVTATGGLISNGGGIGYGGGELGFAVTTGGATSGIYTLATASPIIFFDHRATSNTGSFAFRNGTGAATTLLNISGTGVVTINNLGSGTVTATSGVLSAVSDMNLKIEDGFIDNALEKVLNLKPRYFHWNEESGLPTDIRQLGFYAQEVNEALGEEAANSPKTKNENWGIYDRGIIAMLTKAIQELKAEIDLLKGEPIIPTDNNLE